MKVLFTTKGVGVTCGGRADPVSGRAPVLSQRFSTFSRFAEHCQELILFSCFFFTFDQNYILCNLKVPCGEFLRSVEPRLRTSVLSVQLHNALTLFGVGHFHTATLESAGAWGN